MLVNKVLLYFLNTCGLSIGPIPPGQFLCYKREDSGLTLTPHLSMMPKNLFPIICQWPPQPDSPLKPQSIKKSAYLNMDASYLHNLKFLDSNDMCTICLQTLEFEGLLGNGMETSSPHQDKKSSNPKVLPSCKSKEPTTFKTFKL